MGRAEFRNGNTAILTKPLSNAPESSWWADADDFYGQAKKEQDRMRRSKYGYVDILNREAVNLV